MEKAKISASQLFILMVLFELGSALLVPLAIDAKQDAWLAILLGMVFSFVLLLVYHRLYTYYPDLLPTEYMQRILGKVLGTVLAFVYILYFMYDASRVLRDFGEMLLTFAYPDTPLFIANAFHLARKAQVASQWPSGCEHARLAHGQLARSGRSASPRRPSPAPAPAPESPRAAAPRRQGTARWVRRAWSGGADAERGAEVAGQCSDEAGCRRCARPGRPGRRRRCCTGLMVTSTSRAGSTTSLLVRNRCRRAPRRS